MGDVTSEMPRRTPLFARGPVLLLVALAVAGVALGLVLLATRGGGSVSHAGAKASAPSGEIDLTRLTAQQLRPVGAQVDKASVRRHRGGAAGGAERGRGRDPGRQRHCQDAL